MSQTKKILFGHHGRYGDIIIGVPSTKLLKQLIPDSKVFVNINKQYKDISPLVKNNYIDDIFISDEYENFPNEADKSELSCRGVDIFFHPMQTRLDESDWWIKRHQVIDCAYHYGLPNWEECSNKIDLIKWWIDEDKFNKTIAFHATPANYDKNNKKSFTREKSQELVNEIIKLGYTVLQVGAAGDSKLDNVIKIDTDFFGSIKNILRCDLFLGGDSGLTWALSGYNFTVLACYSNDYYVRNGINYIHNIQPVNPNALYLQSNNVNNIPNEIIIDKIKQMI